MKISLKNIIVFGALTALVSCGGDNKSSSSGSGSGTIYSSGTSNGSTTINSASNPEAVNSLFSQLSSALPCSSGQRISNVLQYSIQGGTSSSYYSTNKLSGSFRPGTIAGNVGQLYMGTSTFNDLMIVAEITNGNTVLGHNVYVSMCAYQNLIFEGRTLSNFQAPYGIVLSKSTSCPYGVISSAKETYMQADPYQSQYGQIYAAPVVTTFYNIQCN
ncbi:hypothetical protein [Bacteriovorax sp. Seq25_V]|uniref:hypothetical protein n=1 Tax=Bacteriovorax sp. Seq25_V TaxID=1201288 RepID=UPI00038A38B7|nr:hypothetical protein [Bacteriovorax sp. Seq25_V]EQC47361.1 putative lipoprotein [Bacteriovorax sp. Seq25_V]